VISYISSYLQKKNINMWIYTSEEVLFAALPVIERR
jgi:hypothetical protein